MNNLESFTDFHKRKRKDCIESVENYLRGKHFEAVELSKPSKSDFLINFERTLILELDVPEASPINVKPEPLNSVSPVLIFELPIPVTM